MIKKIFYKFDVWDLVLLFFIYSVLFIISMVISIDESGHIELLQSVFILISKIISFPSFLLIENFKFFQSTPISFTVIITGILFMAGLSERVYFLCNLFFHKRKNAYPHF